LGSILGLEAVYSDLEFFVIFLGFTRQFVAQYLQIGNEIFFSHPFQCHS